MRVATAKVGTLQALLETESHGSTSDSMVERELVRLRHSHDRLQEVARDLGFNAAGLLAFMLMMTRFFALVLGDCAKPCLIAWAIFDLLVFFFSYFVFAHEQCI